MLDDIKKTLWASADKLRANMDAAEYKHLVLGLIFVKYISDAFVARQAELTLRLRDPADELFYGDATDEDIAAELEDRDYYTSENVFWVPEGARWEALRAAAPQPDIGKRIDEALSLIETDNPKLKGILDKRFARAQLPDGKLGELVDLVSTIGFGEDAAIARDVLGQVYEYFLGMFASAEGKRGGQFYTPASIVKTLVAVLAPHHGKVYDPCCGSGGMFVQSEKFIEAHGGKKGDVSIYGQESNPTTWRLAAMNLAIRGIDYNLGREPADTFTRNQHPDLRADYILANPPFNISDWWHGSLEGDPRWEYGDPPHGNANYAWLQHMLYHLKPSGRAGIVLANGSMSSSQNSEGEIRRAMVDADVVEVMVALPGQLFFNTQIPACLWFLVKQKQQRKGEVLFIDARKLGTSVSRVQIELLGSDIERIAQTVANWRGEPLDVGGEIAEYQDIAGFCRSVKLAEIAEHGHGRRSQRVLRVRLSKIRQQHHRGGRLQVGVHGLKRLRVVLGRLCQQGFNALLTVRRRPVLGEEMRVIGRVDALVGGRDPALAAIVLRRLLVGQPARPVVARLPARRRLVVGGLCGQPHLVFGAEQDDIGQRGFDGIADAAAPLGGAGQGVDATVLVGAGVQPLLAQVGRIDRQHTGERSAQGLVGRDQHFQSFVDLAVLALAPLLRLLRLGTPIGAQFLLEMGVFAAERGDVRLPAALLRRNCGSSRVRRTKRANTRVRNSSMRAWSP